MSSVENNTFVKAAWMMSAAGLDSSANRNQSYVCLEGTITTVWKMSPDRFIRLHVSALIMVSVAWVINLCIDRFIWPHFIDKYLPVTRYQPR